MPMNLHVGDRVTLKKKHPCGSQSFLVLRTGADFRIRCMGCGHEVWIPRTNLEKRIRRVDPAENNTQEERS